MPLKPLLWAFCLVATPAFAQNYPQISLNSEISQSIANDELHATLSKTAQATDAKTLSVTLNHALSQAMSIAKNYPDVKLSTGNQYAHPRHDKNGKIIGLTGSVSITLNSQNFEQAGELIGRLQTIMTMDSLSFDVSEQSRQQHKTTLMQMAIARFQQDAQNVTEAFGAKEYRLISAKLDEQNTHYAPMLKSVAMSEMMDAREPTLSSGDSTLRYHISGTIELVP
ncbi:MAG: SIMPL domain-containing protein [Moraxella sp.]|nr:SIMPL domain-containing protein [Moraxella sp.]